MLVIHYARAMVFPRQWKMGEDTMLLKTTAEDVSYIVADGKELNYLWNRFDFVRNNRFIESGKPGTLSIDRFPELVRYYGDDAKFIVGNLT